MPLKPRPDSKEAQKGISQIATAEQAKTILLGLIKDLDVAQLDLAAIHVNAAIEQICSDLARLRSEDL